MAVKNDLPGLTPGGRKPEPVHRIIKTPFQKNKEIFTGNPGHTQRPFKEEPELSFLHSVNPPKPLFFTQLQTVITPFPKAPFWVFSGGRAFPVNSAFVALTTLPFKHKLFAFRPAKTAYRPGISSHSSKSPSNTRPIYGAFYAVYSRCEEWG
jgi:hypothetical protein